MNRLAPLAHLRDGELLIHEIYASIQGESSYAGLPCTFVRTTACHLRCRYCDTPHAFFQGAPMSLAAVFARVRELSPRLVELTGGEPLLQPLVLPLMRILCDEGFRVLLETSGACPIDEVDPRVVRIVDIKTPASGEHQANRWENLTNLRPHDEVKLVIGSEADYDWARQVIATHKLTERCTVLMGVAHGWLADASLVGWILRDALPVRFQLQMHKVIWGAETRGV